MTRVAEQPSNHSPLYAPVIEPTLSIGGDALVTLRCDAAARMIYLSRASTGGGASVTIRTTSTARTIEMMPTGGTPPYIAVAITPDGKLHVGDDELDAPAFQQRIGELGRANAQMEVQLRADRAVPYGQVAELIGWVQAAGLNRIAFVAQAAASAP